MSNPMTDALTVRGQEPTPPPTLSFSHEQITLIKTTLAPDLDNREFELFIEVCKASALNPFMRQIYALKPEGREGKLVIHIGIDGYRAIAQRSGFFGGKGRPMFGRPTRSKYGPEDLVVPEDCEITIRRLVPGGGSVAVVGYCRFDEFARTVKERDAQRRPTGRLRLNSMWASMPYNQLAKCTEAQAIRSGFQNETEAVFFKIQQLGVALDLRGDLGGEDSRDSLVASARMALEAGQTGTRVYIGGAGRTAETLASMRAAAQADARAAEHARIEAAVREQMSRQETPEAKRASAQQAERTRALGHLFGLWREVFGDPRPKDKAERERLRQERIRKMAELLEIDRPDFDSWDKLTDAEIGEATARLEVLRQEMREAAAAAGPDDPDDDMPPAVPAPSSGREPGDEADGQPSMFARGRR